MSLHRNSKIRTLFLEKLSPAYPPHPLHPPLLGSGTRITKMSSVVCPWLSTLCCAWDVARIACKCCGKLMPLSLGRPGYVALLFAACIVSWCVGTFLPTTSFGHIAMFRECPAGSRACVLTLTVSRAMLAMVVFHALHAIIMIRVRTNSDARHKIQDGWWPIKLALLAGLVAGAIYMPNAFYVGYQWVSLSGAAVFIVAQFVILVDVASALAHRLIEKMEKADARSGDDACCHFNCWTVILVVLSSALFAAAIVANALAIEFYAIKHGAGTCNKYKLNAFFASFDIILGVGVVALSVLPMVRERKSDSGVFQASVVCAYASWIMFSVVACEPHAWIAGCNALFSLDAENGAGQIISLATGALFAVVAVICFAVRLEFLRFRVPPLTLSSPTLAHTHWTALQRHQTLVGSM
jgi:hypothetical protein